jgi:hypothetical protein
MKVKERNRKSRNKYSLLGLEKENYRRYTGSDNWSTWRRRHSELEYR